MTEDKIKPEDMLDEDNLKDGAPLDDAGHPETESETPVVEQDSPEGGSKIPDDSIPLEEKLDLLKAALETSEAKASEYLDGWQRAQAEFANYKKRVNREREQVNKDAVGRVVKNYLPIVDDLELALKDRPQEGDSAAWADGIELIYRKLVAILENDGVVPMKVEGEMFDPNLHEAVVQTESDEHQSGQVIEVLQTGYMIGKRVLRPARVRIAA